MKDITVPEELGSLSDDELTALGNDIREAAEALAGDAATSDEALSEVERLVAEFDRVNGELAAREAKAAERADRAAAALSKIGTPAVDEEITDADADADATEVAASTDDAAELASDDEAETAELTTTDDVVELSADDDETEATAAEDTTEATADDTVETAAEDTTEATTEATTEFSSEDDMPETPNTANLAQHRPEGVAPVTESAPSSAMLLASNVAPGITEGTVLDRDTLALAITKKRHGMNSGYERTGSYERIIMGTAQSDLPNKVGGSAEENFEVFSNVQKDWKQFRSQQTALVASGGNCAPLEPSYEFFRLARPLNPVESALPTVEAPRGGIRFITPPIWTQAQPGVRVTTEAEDADGYEPDGPTEPKPCVHVECQPIEECRVDAVSQCVTFGNLNYRVFPEQVSAFLDDLAVAFTQTKEIHYLDGIDNASTAVTALGSGYGATRSSTLSILQVAANYRRRQHMAPDAVLTLMLPSWFVEFIKVDLINDHMMGLGFLTAGEAEVNAWLASFNLDVAWYYDSATGAGQAFNDAQGAGNQNVFPSSVVAYIFAPGTFVRLDGGTLDVGIVRDSTLNGTNDLQIFSEQWIQVCMVGLESIRLELELCPTGTGPEPVVPLDCGY